MKKNGFIAFFFMFLAALLNAQDGTISGSVTSDLNEPLLGATIVATQISNNTTIGTVANESGQYSLSELVPGERYVVAVSYIGFSSSSVNDILLSSGENRTINFQLVETSAQLNEVQIIARKRVESLYEVPMSLTAFGVKDLADLNMNSAFDIGKNVPNFTINNFGNGNLAHAGLFIRGIGVQDHWITTDPGVGAYLDGVYLGRQMGANLNLLNIKQVEVARGPQGTLFGRNSLGGAVNFITRKPDDNPFTKIQVKGGSLGRFAANLYSSHLIGDKVGVSLSGSFNRRGGIGEFIATPDPVRDIGEINQKSMRIALSYKPIDNLSFLLAFDKSDDAYGQQPYFLELYPGSFLEAFDFADDPDDSASLAKSIQEATYTGTGYSFTAQYDFNDNNSLKLITSKREGDYTGGLDLDGSITFTFPEVGGSEQNSAELQFNGDYGKFNLVTGLYYFDEDGFAISDFDFGGGNNRPLDAFQETISKAAYVSFGLDLSDKLTLSGGLRYSMDEKKGNAALGIFGDASPDAATRAFGEEDWSALTWDIALNYSLHDNLNLYGLVSRGYQSGGFPARAGFGSLEAFVPYDEQYATNFEVGLKGRPTNNLQLGLSAFYVKYTDLQLVFNEAQGDAFISITENAGESRSFGAELDANWVLGRNVKIKAAIGYLDSEVTQLDDGVTATRVGDVPFFSPKLTASLSPQINAYFKDDSRLAFTLNYSFRDEMYGQSLNSDENLIESRSLIGLNIGYTFKDPSWLIEFYGENLADEVYENAITDNAGIQANQVVLSNDRREFGIRITKTIGKF